MCPVTAQQWTPANMEEVISVYGLPMWVEQSYKQVKHALGWSQYQVRSDQAIRRHWQLVCCAFSFCWYAASHYCSGTTQEPLSPSEPEDSSPTSVSAAAAETGGKNQPGTAGAAPRVLAGSPSGRARVVGTLDHAVALLASVVRAAPT